VGKAIVIFWVSAAFRPLNIWFFSENDRDVGFSGVKSARWGGKEGMKRQTGNKK